MPTFILEPMEDDNGNWGYVTEEMKPYILRGLLTAPYNPLLLSHDLLEHKGVATGTVENELHAIGALWFVRGAWGDLNYERQNYNSAEDTIGAEIGYMLGGIHRDLKPASMKRIAGQTALFRDDIESCLEVAGNIYRTDTETQLPEAMKKTALYHIMAGVRWAMRRYKNQNFANSLFRETYNELKRVMPKNIDESSEWLKIQFNYSRSTVTAETCYPEDPYPY